MNRERYATGTPWEPVVGYSRAIRAGSFVFVSGTGTSDVDLVIGDKSIAELRLTGSSFRNEGDEFTEDFFATVPLSVFRKMLVAKTIRGYIYWRSENEVVEKNELRLFTLDAKAQRTLAALDAKA